MITKLNYTISTNKGIYTYLPTPLYYGRKLIDREVCRVNLLLFKSILDKHNIPFGIIFGTLLGAVREKNFISHDEDVDVYILNENRELLLELLFEFKEHGFEVARYDDNLLSLIRDNDYIDIYFFRKNILGNRVCASFILNSDYFKKFDRIEFLNEEFNAPFRHIKFLEKAYGRDWMIPKKNSPANISSILLNINRILSKLKLKLKLKMPILFNIFKSIYKWRKK